ncbi:HAD family hydrolase [Edwardsiella tarda]|uniref:HAD family hydrolase n=1 Tax=Edwardsiella tarda TaxID=636 RepID=UPI001F5BA978|nr:HAD family hydrolase [Edwardsiella tarda]UCQ11754.1 HAD family hydrolase [Edwardsiella tarda]
MDHKPALIFDVNETLLDLDHLAPLFNRLFGSPHVLREWFAQLVLYAQSLTLNHHSLPFGVLGGEVLKIVAATHGKALPAGASHDLQRAIATLPVWPEVPQALARLKAAGFSLYTLTNNSAEVLHAQLDAAAIAHHFTACFSVDELAAAFKPAPVVYRAVEQRLGLAGSALCLVAAIIGTFWAHVARAGRGRCCCGPVMHRSASARSHSLSPMIWRS